MRIGIWCDYHHTLKENSGIGIFVFQLVRGLLDVSSGEQFVLVSSPGEESVLQALKEAGQGRVTVCSTRHVWKPKAKFTRFLRGLNRWINHRRKMEGGILDRGIVPRLTDYLERGTQSDASAIIDRCDVWLLPSPTLDQRFSKPTVVAIHDLIPIHFPAMKPGPKLASFKEQVIQTANLATKVVCMAEFIREHDLINTLGLSRSKTEVIRAAVPQDLLQTSLSRPDRGLDIYPHEYLLYPAAFRPHKNHEFLIRGFSEWLSDNHGKSNIRQIIFTGQKKMPSRLVSQIRSLGLSNQVVGMPNITRSELAWLYTHAFATICPSLYEQGSFPAIEAMSLGCPVAISDIPVFREQFSIFGDSMLYFNPRNPSELSKTIVAISSNREKTIENQSVCLQAMRQYTWKDAARQWLAVLHDASCSA